MMRTVCITLTLALAVLIAAPLLAAEGGKGPPRGGFFGAMGNPVPRILARLTLSDDEKAATKAIVDELGPKIEAAQKEAAPTEKQRAAIKEAMTELRGKDATREQMTEAINKAAKWTDEQTKAREKAAKLVKEETEAVVAKLTPENKEAFKKASERRPGAGAPGGRKGSRKAKAE